MKKILLGFFDVIEFFVSTAAVAILIYLFITQPHQVNGASMYPNFHDQEFLLTDKISYRLHKPERGDVVVFSAPPAANCPIGLNCDFIKRIIGLPGEHVIIKQGQIWINGRLLHEPYLDPTVKTQSSFSSSSFLPEEIEKIIPENSYLVLGDNRPASSDSRQWGPVATERLVGKAWLRYWPPKVAGILAFENASLE